jgi:acylpyruvate hydrolase
MKIICVGRNYSLHVKELNNTPEADPVIFMKPETALLQKRQPFFMPAFSNDVHHEIELVLKINKVGKNIAEKFAEKYFDEIGLGIDFTARDLQQKLKSKGLPWELAKSFDGSAPVGNFIGKKFIESAGGIHFHLKVNDEIRQNGNSMDMIFSFSQIISFVSRFITLKKGDLIFTGTPEGVGPVKIGDKLEGFIEDQKLLTVFVR